MTIINIEQTSLSLINLLNLTYRQKPHTNGITKTSYHDKCSNKTKHLKSVHSFRGMKTPLTIIILWLYTDFFFFLNADTFILIDTFSLILITVKANRGSFKVEGLNSLHNFGSLRQSRERHECGNE